MAYRRGVNSRPKGTGPKGTGPKGTGKESMDSSSSRGTGVTCPSQRCSGAPTTQHDPRRDASAWVARGTG